MSPRALGLVLIWVGTVAVSLVAVQRFRHGAWSEAAFDEAPPRAGWMIPLTVLGLVLAAGGLGLMVWTL